MKTMSRTRLLGVLLVTAMLSGQAVMAQDESQSAAADLYKHMYEGGLITEAEYEYAVREGALPGGSGTAAPVQDAEDDQPPATGQPSHKKARDIGPLTRDLGRAGEILTVNELRANQRASLAARAASIAEMQERNRAAVQEYFNTHALPTAMTPEQIADLNAIRLLNGKPLFYGTDNVNAADTVSTDELWPSGSAGVSLSGTNTVFGVWDEGTVRTTHDEFSNAGISRVTNHDATALNLHSTAVAGTLIGSGEFTYMGSTSKGMSFEAALSAYDFFDDLAEMTDAVASNDLRLSNHSYAFVTGWESNFYGLGYWNWLGDIDVNVSNEYKFGFYMEESRLIDELVYDGNYYLPVWAAGNERSSIDLGPPTQPIVHTIQTTGGVYLSTLVHNSDGDTGQYDTLQPQGTAKNALTVGAVEDIIGGYSNAAGVVLASFSSLGPTDDGRIKPDLVANGVSLLTAHSAADDAYTLISGTSFSTPSVAGSLNLLSQLYSDTYGTNRFALASTLKGLAIHTADEAGDAPGPDYRFGWGLLNSLAAAQAITNDAASGSKAHVKEVFLLDGDFIEFPVVATNSQPLKVTTAWTDVPGEVPALSVDPTNLMLINDLDLRLIDSSGGTNFPWVLDPANPTNAATTGDNYRDNVEQVYIASPTSGTYTVRVTHKGTLSNGLQAVSILISGNIPQAKPEFDVVSFSTDTTPTNVIAWASLVGQLYRVQTTDDLLSGSWQDVSGDISATKTNVAFPVSTNALPDLLFYRAVEVE